MLRGYKGIRLTEKAILSRATQSDWRSMLRRYNGMSRAVASDSRLCFQRSALIAHRAYYFFYFGDVDHHYGIPGAAVQEGSVGAFA